MCRADPGLFDGQATAREARHVCRHHCPVLAECEEWAVGARLTFVTAGGIAWNSDGTKRVMGMGATAHHSTACRALVRALDGEVPGVIEPIDEDERAVLLAELLIERFGQRPRRGEESTKRIIAQRRRVLCEIDKDAPRRRKGPS